MTTFTIPIEPAHDGTAIEDIADRLNIAQTISDEGLRAWYPRDVAALLRAVYQLRDEQRERFWAKEANQRLRERVAELEGALVAQASQYEARLGRIRGLVAAMLSELEGPC